VMGDSPLDVPVMSLASILAVASSRPIRHPQPSHHPTPAPVSSFSSSYFGEHLDDTDTVADGSALQNSSRESWRRSGTDLSGGSFRFSPAVFKEDEQETGAG
jgi:hypothetical protein